MLTFLLLGLGGLLLERRWLTLEPEGRLPAAGSFGEVLALGGESLPALALLGGLFALYRCTTPAAAKGGVALAAVLYMLLPLCRDFLTLYLLVEAANMALYRLLATATPPSRLEPVVTYFLVNLLGSLLLLLGFGFIYWGSGSLSFGEVALLLQPSTAGLGLVAGASLEVGLILVLGALLLKVGLAPLHFWVTPVYEGLPLHLFVFLQLFPKGALMALLLTLGGQLGLQGGVLPGLERLLLAVATLNLVWGSVGALHQTSLRRLLVYSSMANLSLPLYALAAVGGGSSPSALLYLLLYLATTATLLLPLLATVGVGERWCLVELSRGVDGPLRILLTVALLNLSGVPPFALFFAKLPVALELAERGFYLSLLLLLVFSVVGVAYAFQLLAHLWFRGQPAVGVVLSTPTVFSALPLLLGYLYLNLGAPASAAAGAAAGHQLPLVPLNHNTFGF